MKLLTTLLLSIAILSNVFSQNTLDLAGLTASTPSASAYSLRKLSSSYGGYAVKVRRVNDNNTLDVGFDVNGDLDIASLLTFAAGNTVQVTKWYDQSGNGRDLEQTNTSKQPYIVSDGFIFYRNEKPMVYFDGTDDGLDFTGTAYLTSGSISVNLIAGSYNNAGGIRRAIQGTTVNWLVGPYNNQMSYHPGGWRLQLNEPWKTSAVEIFTVTQNASNTGGFFRNGVAQTLTGSANSYPQAVVMGAEGVTAEPLNGYISELITFQSELSTTERGDLEMNQTNYYAITTGPHTLDNAGLTASELATSAYSLRKLSSTYTGYAIRIKRSNDNATLDVGFSGNYLDTAAIRTFIGANSATVIRWYDQSGNNRILDQLITSREPKIMNAGSFYFRNGKVTVYFDGTDDGLLFNGADYLKTGDLSVNLVAGSNSTSASARRAVAGTTNWLLGPYDNKHSYHPLGWNHYISEPWSTTGIEVFTVVQPQSNANASFRNGTAQTTSNTYKGMPLAMHLGYEKHSQPLNGYISEVITFNSELNTTARGNLEANQFSFYAIQHASNTLNNVGLSSSYLAESAYSLRKLSTTYSGNAIRVRRTDGKTLDIGFVSNYLDTNTLKTFVGANSATVEIWYDQSGNGRDLEQTTVANQPIIVENGNIKYRNQKVTTYFDATNDGMYYNGANYLTTNPLSVNLVAGSNSSSTTVRRAVQGSATNWLVGPYSNQHRWYAGNWNHTISEPWLQGYVEQFTVIQQASAANNSSWRNQLSQTLTGSFNTVPYKIQMGNSGFLNERLDGYISEVLTFSLALDSTGRQALEGNQDTYYGITLSHDADLGSLTPSVGSLTTSFSANTLNYNIEDVKNSVNSITLTPTLSDASATLELQLNGGGYSTITSGIATSALNLNVGSNTIQLKVTAEDGYTIKIYTLTIVRLSYNEPVNALNLDGINDYAYYNAGNPLNGDFTSMTLEAWIKTTDGASGDYPNIVGFNHNGNYSGHYYNLQFRVHYGKLEYGINLDNGNFWQSVISSTSVNDGNWHHVAAVRNGNSVQLYVDGLLDGSGTITNNFTPNQFLIGSYIQDGFVGAGFFNGTLEEIRVWNTARTQNDIVSNMFSELAGNETGLRAYYNMNQGAGGATNTNLNVLNDLTSNNYNIALTNLSLTGSTSNWVNSTAFISNNANLYTVTSSVGTITADLDNSTTTYYIEDVPNSISSLTLTPSAVNGFSTLELQVNGGGYSTITNGVATSSIPLSSGANTINIKVTATDGVTTKTYTFNVNRLVTDEPWNALNFDGTNDFISVPYNSAFNFTNNFTIEAWLKPNTVGGNTIQNVVCKSSDVQNNSYAFPRTYNNWGNITAILHVSGAWDNVSAPYPSDGLWHHTALTYDGVTAKIFIDGELVASKAIAGPVSTNTNVLCIGNQTNFGAEHYKGDADEIRIWNTTRTQEQILENMYNELQGNESGLVAYYNMNQGAGGTTNTNITVLEDGTSNGHNGTLTNFGLSTTTSNWVNSDAKITSTAQANNFVRAGNCLNFDGTDDYVNVGDNIEGFTAITKEAWVYLDAYPPYWSDINSKELVSAFAINDLGYLHFNVGDGANWIGGWNSSTTIPLNTWTHIAATWDGSTVTLYINGLVDNTYAFTGTVGTNGISRIIGGKTDGINFFSFVNGKIDEVRTWSDARTEAEIRGNMYTRLSGTEANLVAYYTFDAESGTTLADKTSNVFNGTLNNMAGTEWTSASDREPAKAFTADGNWNTASTWLDGSVPNASTQSVFVPVNTTLDATVDANIVNVASGATLTIDNDNTLSTTSNVLNDGTITIENTGALVQGSSSGLGNGGTFNVKKTAFGNTGALQYNVFSAPISDGSVNSLGNNRYWFDPSAATTTLSDGWQAASGAMTVGRGYFATNSNNVTFSGTANNGDITYTATAATNGSDKIMNLIGNPYPSGLNLTNFMANGTNNTNLTGTLYFWDDDGTAGSSYATNGYATWSGGTWTQSNNADKTGAGTAAGSAQGFIVVPKSGVADGSFNIEFTNSMREGNSTVFFKKDFQRLWINLQDDSIFMSQTAVVLNDQATNGFDETFDAPRIANANSPLINCKVDTVNCAIGTYQPPFEGENTLVQLQLWVPTGKEYTLAFSEFEGLEAYNIYLVNDWEGTITPLSSLNEVKVNLQQGNNEQLYLVFKAGATVGVEEAHENKLSYSSTNDQLVVFGLEENTTITILNLNGQVVQTATTTNGMVNTSALAGGVYLARVSNSTLNETIKFYKN